MKFVFLIILLMSVAQVKADIIHELSQLEPQDQQVYASVVKMCLGHSLQQNSEKMRIWFNAFSQSSIIATATQLKNPTGIYQLTEFDKLTSSRGFHLALKKCFGSNDNRKTVFVVSLLVLESTGKLASWIADYTLLRSLYIGVSTSIAEQSLNLKLPDNWYKIIFNVRLAQPGAWKIIAGRSLIGLGDLSNTMYLAYLKSNEMDPVLREKKEQELLKLEERVKTLKTKIDNSVSPEDAQLISFFLQKDLNKITKIKEALDH